MDAQQGAAGRGIVFPMPALLFPPPPPPIQLSYYSYASPTSHHSSSITNFPILLLTVLGILTTSVLLLTYYVFVIRCCLKWHHDDVAGLVGGRHRGSSNTTTTSSSSRLNPVTGTPAAEATTRGLEESTIQALPTFRYKKAIKKSTDSAPTSECAVCLGEFEEEERVRMLPSCLHAFHVDCIDTWLQGNANCPLCRAPIIITGHCMLLPSEPQRPEEVVIQVLADGTQAQQQHTIIAAAESAGDTASTTDQQLGGGDEVRLQIHSILQRNAQFRRDDDSVSSSSTNNNM